MGRTVEILLYDVIGYDMWTGEGCDARWFADQLKQADLRAGDELVLRVDCPGGIVTDGLAMYNQLLACPAKKIARVEGHAASAASVVIQGCDEIEVAAASMVMIHRAWGITAGNAEDHFTSAALLEKFDGVIADVYALRSGSPAAAWLEAMTAESWYTGPEAVDAKLADRLIKPAAAASEPEETPAAARRAQSHLRVLASYRNLPAALQARVELARAESRALNAENVGRAEQIRDLSIAMLESNRKKESESGAEDRAEQDRTAAQAARAAELHSEMTQQIMRAELALVEGAAAA